jgi:hypothetical protein
MADVNAVQYIDRLKFLGLPFHAKYPIASAMPGKTTKTANSSIIIPVRIAIVGFMTASLP